ncbi:MAG: M15 family metallopeptidase [Rickettsia endosymbiont of Labidopullus appendiculatus]|nr:M15 family metallopeptidase [Rickettsia endosymbiont of Labidopullus appendiculatus]
MFFILQKKYYKYIFISLLLIILNTVHSSFAAKLPENFVYLKDINPTIIENLRYYSTKNFCGKVIDGYKANRVILTKPAAEALSAVQKELLANGYSLVIYDAYRPQRAVNDFIKWAKDLKDQTTKANYYPNVDKADLFKLGYIDAQSPHSRGSTLDLTIIKSSNVLHDIKITKRKLTDGRSISFLDDGTVDMGSSFDLFDKASYADNKLISPEYLTQRDYLRTIMTKHGFTQYGEEWWDYTLSNEPFPNTYFDFEIE